jgi:hypothetical protein
MITLFDKSFKCDDSANFLFNYKFKRCKASRWTSYFQNFLLVSHEKLLLPLLVTMSPPLLTGHDFSQNTCLTDQGHTRTNLGNEMESTCYISCGSHSFLSSKQHNQSNHFRQQKCLFCSLEGLFDSASVIQYVQIKYLHGLLDQTICSN